MIVRSRGYLPHIEAGEAIYFVTFRLAGSLPGDLLGAWRSETEEIIANAHQQNRKLSEYEIKRLNYLHLERIEKFLNSGKGERWLESPRIAKVVADALKYFDGTRYQLHTWCVMPNHVHVLFTPKRKRDQSTFYSLLIPILHSWKSYTASKANQILNRKGKFWQEDYFDTIVKSDRQFAFYICYILQNPVKAGLCKHWQDWQWSGCSQKISELMNA